MAKTNYHSDHSNKLAKLDRTWSNIKNNFQYIKQQGYDLSDTDQLLEILLPLKNSLKDFVNSKNDNPHENNS